MKNNVKTLREIYGNLWQSLATFGKLAQKQGYSGFGRESSNMAKDSQTLPSFSHWQSSVVE
jgi:hypothetical protein